MYFIIIGILQNVTPNCLKSRFRDPDFKLLPREHARNMSHAFGFRFAPPKMWPWLRHCMCLNRCPACKKLTFQTGCLVNLSSVWLGNKYECWHKLISIGTIWKSHLNLGNESPNPTVESPHLITHFQFTFYTLLRLAFELEALHAFEVPAFWAFWGSAFEVPAFCVKVTHSAFVPTVSHA